MKSIFQTRTFWAGLATVVSAVLSIFKVSPEVTQTITAVFGFLTVLFVRDAIEQNGVGTLTVYEVDADNVSDSRQP
jgi:hypothetical protein